MQVVLVSNINHMRSFSLFLLTTVLSLSTFAQSDKVDVHGFKNEYELEKFLTPIDIQGQIFQAHAMASDGKYFFVTNDKEVPPIKSYRLSDGKFMGGFGSIGGGPGEFTILNRSGFGIRKGQLVVQGRKYVRIYDLVEKKDKLDFDNLSEPEGDDEKKSAKKANPIDIRFHNIWNKCCHVTGENHRFPNVTLANIKIIIPFNGIDH